MTCVVPITHPESLKQLLMSYTGKVFESIYSTIMSNEHISFGKGFCLLLILWWTTLLIFQSTSP